MSDDDFYQYLPVNDNALNWGVYVTGVGRTRILPGKRYPPLGHPAVYQCDWRRGRTLPEFAMVLICEGSGIFESVEVGEVAIDVPSIVFLFPGVWHRYRPLAKTGWVERWTCFNGDYAHRLAELGLITPAEAVLSVTNTEHLQERFDRFVELIRSYPVDNSILLSLDVLGLISDCLSCTAHGFRSEPATVMTSARHIQDSIARAAIDLIWTHSHRPLSVDEIARQLLVTRRTLDRRFAAATGRSVLGEINACRLSRAKRLLTETDLSIKTIANVAGFSSVKRMRITFIAEGNDSPSHYRREKSVDQRGK
jgi:AraC-like DNA-binding protein